MPDDIFEKAAEVLPHAMCPYVENGKVVRIEVLRGPLGHWLKEAGLKLVADNA